MWSFNESISITRLHFQRRLPYEFVEVKIKDRKGGENEESTYFNCCISGGVYWGNSQKEKRRIKK
jgi:hypothetical protein